MVALALTTIGTPWGKVAPLVGAVIVTLSLTTPLNETLSSV
jgi:hypothetical protein